MPVKAAIFTSEHAPGLLYTEACLQIPFDLLHLSAPSNAWWLSSFGGGKGRSGALHREAIQRMYVGPIDFCHKLRKNSHQ